MTHRGPLGIDRLITRQRPDQAIQVARLEVVRLGRELAQVRDTVVRRRGAEHRTRAGLGGHRRQRRPAAGRAAADRQPGAVGLAGVGQRPRGRDRVLHVDDAPLTAEPLPVAAAVAGRAPVVDVDDAYATAGEIRLLDVEQRHRVSGGPAVHPDHVGGQLAGGRRHVRVGGRVHQGMDRAPELPFQHRLPGRRQVAGVSGARLLAEHLHRAGGGIDPDDGQGRRRPARDAQDGHPVRRQAGGEDRVPDVEVGQLPGFRVEQPQPHLAPAVQHREPAVAQDRVRALTELPERARELLLGRVEGLRRLADQAHLVEVPPARPVGDHVQAGRVAPQGRQNRFLHAALDQPAPAGHAILDRCHPQLGPVPGHARMVPADPGQALAVRGRRGERVEVRAGDKLADGRGIRRRGAVERDADDGPDHLAVVMPLLDAPHLGAVGGEGEVGETERRLPRAPARPGGQRARIAAAPAVGPGRVQQVEPLIGMVREHDRDPAAGGRHRQVGQAAVLVHPGPGVPRLGQQRTPPGRPHRDARSSPALPRRAGVPATTRPCRSRADRRSAAAARPRRRR